MERFDYTTAFNRNIGWFTPIEQKELRGKRIGIAGCGGVGGIHATTLARLGIGNFHLADMDVYGVENFNRQVGATMETIGAPKVEVIKKMISEINPEATVRIYSNGVNAENLDSFLEGVDLFVDGLDFFASHARQMVFNRCAELNIPAITAGPFGMGTVILNFLPGEMTFEEYFGMSDCPENEKTLRFYLGLAPALLQNQYLVDPTTFDVANKKGPSTIIGCTMAAGVVGAEVVKILLKRGEVIAAPKGMQWDPYLNTMVITEMAGGKENEEFIMKVELGKKQFGIE